MYSLVVAQVGTLVVVYFIDLAEKRKSGGKYKNFYLLEETEDNELLALSFKGTKRKCGRRFALPLLFPFKKRN
mgnify:CR=1 FL=1